MSGLVTLPLSRSELPRRFRPLLQLVTLSVAFGGQLAAQVTASDATVSRAVRVHFSAAQEAQQRRDYSAAETEYRAVLAEVPNFAEVHMNLGLLFQLQNRTPEAMAEFRSALKIKPTLAGANFFLGVDYCKSGNGAKAIPYLKAASRQEPNRSDIWSWLAIAQEISGDHEAEVRTLNHALIMTASSPMVARVQGHLGSRIFPAHGSWKSSAYTSCEPMSRMTSGSPLGVRPNQGRWPHVTRRKSLRLTIFSSF